MQRNPNVRVVFTGMNTYSLSSVFHQAVVYRELVWEMTKRDLKMLHKGSVLGFYWLVVLPLIQVLSYVVIVAFIFGRGTSAATSPLDYCIYVLSGMLPWQMLARALQDAPGLITSRTEMLKQVRYPIATLPTSSIAISSIAGLVNFVVYLLFALGMRQVAWSLVLLPVPFVMLVTFLLGMSWILSVVGVIFKDLREIIAVTMGLSIYFSPVIVKETAVSPTVWKLILCNPLSHVIIAFHDLVYAEFHPLSWTLFFILSVAGFLLGGVLIRWARVRINDYI